MCGPSVTYVVVLQNRVWNSLNIILVSMEFVVSFAPAGVADLHFAEPIVGEPRISGVLDDHFFLDKHYIDIFPPCLVAC